MVNAKCSERGKNMIEILGVVLLSIIIFLVIGQGNLNFGLFDDNKSQWLSVIDKAYETLFRTGKLPTIDFYQMKGMKIYDQGYYGLWNPFMLAAYIIRTYLLNFLDTNTISVYIFLMIVSGNICCCKIFKECGNSHICAVLSSGVMMSVSIYVALSYWYYIYNVYFILTWIMFRLIRNREKQSYYDCGTILALSLLMGNIQYTVYMYIAYTVINIIFFCQKKRESAVKWLSNSICMGVLSLLPLVMLLQASSRTINFSRDNSEYYSSAVHPLIAVLFSWFPSEFIRNVSEKAETWIYANSCLPDTGFFPGARSVYLGVLLCAAVIFVMCRKRYKKDSLYEIAQAGMITAGLLVLLSFGKTGVLAVFAHQMPFLDSFRIMMKWFVLIPPLLVPCIGVVMREQKQMHGKSIIFGVLVLFATLGIMQNRAITFDTSTVQTNTGIQRLNDLGVDYHDYRILSFARVEEIQVTYPQWENFDDREQINYEEKYSKNIGTTAGITTLGGYDLAFAYEQWQMSDHIMGSMSGYATEFGYDNMVIEEYFLQKYSRDNLNYWQEIKVLKEQILDNSVKYCIFTKDSKCLPIFLQILQDMDLTVEWQQDFLEHTTILSIKEIGSLVQSINGKKVNANITMDKITFAAQDASDFRVGMYYDKDLRASYIGKNGEKTTVTILPDEKGFFLISDIPRYGGGVVEITYLNRFYMLCQIWIVIEVLAIGILLFAPGINAARRVCQYAGKQMRPLYCLLMDKSPHKKVGICFAGMLCIYVGFMAFYYLHIQCTVPDEDWFLQMFQTIHKTAQGNIFAYFGSTENYLGYGQIYWILGGMCPGILALRTVSYILLMGSMMLTLWEVKRQYGQGMIPYAGLLWMSMPFAWYSDKIIGPEIAGLFTGILGICVVHQRRKDWIGWLLLGVSAAVKVNYMIFLIFAILTVLKKKQMVKREILIKAMGLGASGFLIGNPIILWDVQTYMENMVLGKGFAPEFITNVFELHGHEWDGVMINGVFWGYVSAFLLSAAVLVGICKKIFCKNGERECGDGYIAGILSLCLIFICCREQFLGWYLLPLCYLLVIFVCGQFYVKNLKAKAQNIYQWIFAACLLINGAILLPEHISNRQDNMDYMRIMADKSTICSEIQNEEDCIRQEMPEEVWYYLLDFHMDKYAYNFKDRTDFCLLNAEGIGVIGDRMRRWQEIDDLVQKAIRGEEHLKVLRKTKDAWIIQRENNL